MTSAGVIGWPVAHSLSPVIHRFWLERAGVDGDYSRFAVEPERLGAALAGLRPLGLAGVNVTVPHKVAVIPFLSRLDPLARDVGAVNCIVVEADGGLSGYNSDVGGFAWPLGDRRIGTAIVVGAGGAARAALVALRQRGVERIRVMNRSVDKARTLMDELGISGEAVPLDVAVGPADLLVNASSLGMKGEPPLRLRLDDLPGDAIVYDIVYAPLETELLRAARARGLATVDGLEMLVGQAAEAFERFYGMAPPRDADADLRALLKARA